MRCLPWLALLTFCPFLYKNDHFTNTGSGQTKGKLKKTGVSLGLWPPHPYPDEQLAPCLPVRSAVHSLNPALVELDTIEAAQASLSEAEGRLEAIDTAFVSAAQEGATPARFEELGRQRVAVEAEIAGLYSEWEALEEALEETPQ